MIILDLKKSPPPIGRDPFSEDRGGILSTRTSFKTKITLQSVFVKNFYYGESLKSLHQRRYSMNFEGKFGKIILDTTIPLSF